MKATSQTTRPGHAPSRNVPVKAKPKAQIPAKPVRVKKVHPAEHAGMVVHQTVEAGVTAAKDTVVTAVTYLGKFVQGLYKGH